MDRYTLRPVRYAAVWLLAMALTGCARPAPTVIAPAAPVATSTATQTSTPTRAAPSATSTEMAPATQESTLLAGPEVQFREVSFHLPAELAGQVEAAELPAAERLGELYPSYVDLRLVDYPSRNTSFEPSIQVYPVEGLGQSATEIAQELKDLLRKRPAGLANGLPVLPALPAGELVLAGVQYLRFENGTGIRVVTQFGQDAWPVNNEGLVYVFQGLTSDDRYYISAFLPVSAAFLPDQVSDPAQVPAIDGIGFPEHGSPDFDSAYARYQKAVMQVLSSAPADEFVPSLSLLDSLIGSLQVGPLTDAADAGDRPCLNALPTRLRVDGYAYVNPEPPLPNNVRRDPGKDSPLIGDIRPGQPVKILDGPRCADGWVWWRVRDLETEIEGWTAEGDKQNYWLIPCPSRNQCGV